METEVRCKTLGVFVSSYRTYEEWKPVKISHLFWNEHKFLPYLWGMETCLTSKQDQTHPRSYRTYEEWKPLKDGTISIVVTEFLPYLWGMETKPSAYEQNKKVRFLPYLWGMETQDSHLHMKHNQSSYRTYEEWKPKNVLSTGKTNWVLTVPMRNGNSPWMSFMKMLQKSSYRTYEEWKLV